MAKFKVEGTLYELLTPEQYASLSNVPITQEQVTKIDELNYTRVMTQAQYDALSQAEKDRADVWYGIYKE